MTKVYKEEFPISTLSMWELRIQWKVMQALGYHSLFDPNFRRELRNPVRRFLYYKLVSMDAKEEATYMQELSEYVSDRVGFFTDPELFKKVKNEERRIRMTTEGPDSEEQLRYQAEFDRADKKHKLSEEQQVAVAEFLQKN